MAKKKVASKAPPIPPTSVGHAVVLAAMDEVTETDCWTYATVVMAPKEVRDKMSAKKRNDAAIAMMKLAAVGFAFYQWCKDRDIEPANATE